MDYKGWFMFSDFIDDERSFPMLPLSPEFPVTRTLSIANNDKAIFRGPDVGEAGVGWCGSKLVFGEGLQGMDWDE